LSILTPYGFCGYRELIYSIIDNLLVLILRSGAFFAFYGRILQDDIEVSRKQKEVDTVRKRFVVALVVLVAVLSFAMGTQAAQTVKIFVNGQQLTPDVPAQIIEGRTMVPIRFVAEALGANVSWDANTNSVIITTGAAPAQAQKHQFKGNGSDYTEKIQLGQGLTYVNYQYTGESNFIVWLLDSNGKEVELIANEIGSTSGKKAFSVEPGAYLFNVEAEGSWSITVEQ
jgi:hypothetical protein